MVEDRFNGNVGFPGSLAESAGQERELFFEALEPLLYIPGMGTCSRVLEQRESIVGIKIIRALFHDWVDRTAKRKVNRKLPSMMVMAVSAGIAIATWYVLTVAASINHLGTTIHFA